ncbi:hypothetical protein Q3G72_007181 [Acer saccharum]|nr:hypothetical protein Q3G72_007181 [Acer saccharum]
MESLNVVWIGVFLNLSRDFDRVGSSGTMERRSPLEVHPLGSLPEVHPRTLVALLSSPPQCNCVILALN